MVLVVIEEFLGDVIIINGGGPLFESSGGPWEGPWGRPYDEIKNNITYVCDR